MKIKNIFLFLGIFLQTLSLSFSLARARCHFGPCVKSRAAKEKLDEDSRHENSGQTIKEPGRIPEKRTTNPRVFSVDPRLLSLQSAAHVLARFVYEFFNLCGSVHRLFGGDYGRSSPDHAVHRRGQSGRPLRTGGHGSAAPPRTRRDRRGRKEAGHRGHSPSNHDHN